jgi:two-component system response regulator DegU
VYTLAESHIEAIDKKNHKRHIRTHGNIRVLIADQDAHFRAKIKEAVSREKDMVFVGECTKGLDIPYLCKRVLPHLVIMDLYLPYSSVDIIYQITQTTPQAKVLILSDRDDPYVLETIRSGASGYLLKNLEEKQMLDAIRVIACGGVYIHPIMMGRVINELRRLSRKEGELTKAAPCSWREVLTYREMEVLQLMSQGKNNRSISEHLYISEKTVKNHVSKILYKLNVQDRTQAVLLAIKYGWVPLV